MSLKPHHIHIVVSFVRIIHSNLLQANITTLKQRRIANGLGIRTFTIRLLV